jgi:hypothetical protein
MTTVQDQSWDPKRQATTVEAQMVWRGDCCFSAVILTPRQGHRQAPQLLPQILPSQRQPVDFLKVYLKGRMMKKKMEMRGLELT